jgi:acyl carrier protein
MQPEVVKVVTAIIRKNSIRGAQVEFEVDSNLFELGVLDSIGVLGMIEEIERTLQVRMDADSLLPELFATPGQIFGLCERLLAARTAVSA